LGLLEGQRGREWKVTVVLPAHNEVRSLRRAVEETVEFLESVNQDFEILIAEDGSTDGTAEVARGIADSNLKVNWIHYDMRLGRGRALTEAFKKSSGSVLVYMDVDLSTDVRFLKPLIQAIIDGYDVATGSRGIAESLVSRSLKRAVASQLYNNLVRLFLGSYLRDHQCGFKAFNRESYLRIIDKVQAKHWFWDTEILVLATRMGLRVKEVPVVWKEGEKTEVNLMRDFIRMGLQILKLWWRLDIGSLR